MNLTCCYIAKCNAKRTGCLSESIKVTWYCQVSQDSSQAQYLSKCTCFWPVGERQICFSSFLVKCRWYDNHECVGKDWAESWVVSCFFFFFLFLLRRVEKSRRKNASRELFFSFFCHLYVWKTAGMNAWQKSGTGARQADWNSGRLTGGLVSIDMKYKKDKLCAVLCLCCTLVGWLLIRCVWMCVCVCTRGHEFVTHHLSCPLNTFFSGRLRSPRCVRVELTGFCMNLWKLWT